MAQQMRIPIIMLVLGLIFASLMTSSSVDALAKIETFNPASCDGSATNTFFVNGNTCQTFNDQGAVRISDVSPSTRISVHNQQACEAYSQVAQIYGGGCVVQGQTKLRAVFIQG